MPFGGVQGIVIDARTDMLYGGANRRPEGAAKGY